MTISKNTKYWKFLIDLKKPIATYHEWEVYLSPSASANDYDREKQSTLFYGKRTDLPTIVKGASIRSIEAKINKVRATSLLFRNKCKAMLTDSRKCGYCVDKFMCFTEK